MRVMLEPGAFQPTRAHSKDAGLDIRSMYTQVVPARGYAVFHTGVHVELPPNTAGMIKSKSGLNVRNDIVTTGVIDEGYTGCIVIKLYNLGKNDYYVSAGDKIAQLVVVSIPHVDVEIVPSISGGERGNAGFGSTGK